MKNPFAALARLFRRDSTNTVTTQLFTHGIGQPLLVHPVMGEQLLSAYLLGAIDARPSTLVISDLSPAVHNELGDVVKPARQTAVINVSGGLVNRFEPGDCDPGPLSYQELRAKFDKALNDSAIESIVMRLETPGGMGSGLFDLTDHIYASRGVKPIYAVIDDYAYSAGYGIAAACEEIWITRTGGGGSVGVIGYHYDQSGYDKNIGLKVTAIYSGSHKNDLTPHEPLADDQRAWLQGRMDSMRGLFAESVAKYRSMTVESVLATEAMVYQGQQVIDIGFADRIGTFTELLAELAAGTDIEGTAPALAAPPTASATPTAQARDVAKNATMEADVLELDRAKAVTVVMRSALATDLRAALLAPGVADFLSTTNIDERIAHAQIAADLCTAAGDRSLASTYITHYTNVDAMRSQLLDLKATDGPELDTHPPLSKSAAESSERKQRLSTDNVYSKLNNQSKNK